MIIAAQHADWATVWDPESQQKARGIACNLGAQSTVCQLLSESHLQVGAFTCWNPTPKFGYNVASFRLVGQTTIAPMCRISRESMARWHRGGAACAIRNPEWVDQRVQGPRSSRSALDCQHHCRSQDQATYQERHHGIFVVQCGPMVTGPRPMCRISWQRTSCGTTLAGPGATCAA